MSEEKEEIKQASPWPIFVILPFILIGYYFYHRQQQINSQPPQPSPVVSVSVSPESN